MGLAKAGDRRALARLLSSIENGELRFNESHGDASDWKILALTGPQELENHVFLTDCSMNGWMQVCELPFFQLILHLHVQEVHFSGSSSNECC